MGRKIVFIAVTCALLTGAGYLFCFRGENGPAKAVGLPRKGVIGGSNKVPSTRTDHSASLERPSLSQIVREKKFSGTDYIQFNFGIKLREVTASLKLTPSERERLMSAYLGCILAKAAIETDLVQVIDDREGELILKIPAYPMEGAELKEEFKKILSELFPGSRANDIDDHLGRYFDERALGFGQTEQEMHITREANGTYRIVRTSRVIPGETVTGFREASPLRTMGSTSLLSFDQIRTGEYMSIAPKITGSALNESKP